MGQESYFQKIYFIQFFYYASSEWNEMNEAHVLDILLAQVSKPKNIVKIINNK